MVVLAAALETVSAMAVNRKITMVVLKITVVASEEDLHTHTQHREIKIKSERKVY